MSQGLWAGENEGAHYWLGIMNELRNRGVEDILIACVDGLKGFPEAIHSAFPKTETQLCIVHMIRNSLKYVGSKDQKEFIAGLKTIYKAPSEEMAAYELDKLIAKWGQKYPLAVTRGNTTGPMSPPFLNTLNTSGKSFIRQMLWRDFTGSSER